MKIRSYDSLYLLGFFFLLTLVSYFTVLNAFFLSDDFAQIGRVLEGDYSVTWGLEQGGFFRPVFILSYIIDSSIWGTNPFGYHLTNVALHSLNSFLVVILAARLLGSSRKEPATSLIAISAGLFFLLHPSHTEAVSWVSGRADLLATLFVLCSLISYDSYRREKEWIHLAATLTFFVTALLAKESALCLPLIIIAIEVLSPHENDRSVNFRRILLASISFGAVLILYFAVRYAALGTPIGVYGSAQHLDFKVSLIWERLPKYLARAVLPPFPQQLEFMFAKPFKSRAFVALALMFLTLTSTVAVLRHRRLPYSKRKQQNSQVLLLLPLFLSSLLPVITLGISLFDTAGERFVYLPSVFSSIATAYLIASFISSRKVWWLTIFAGLIFYAASLERSNVRWREASALSRSLLNDLTRAAEHESILITNAPDNLRGVPVYRNGLEHALRTFQDAKPIRHVDVLSTHSLQSKPDISIEIESKTLTIHLINLKDEFSRIKSQIECVRAFPQTRSSLMVIDDCNTNKDFFFFNGREMVKPVPW